MRLLTVRDVDDVFSFRICVESFAIEQALPRMTRADFAGLRAIQDGLVRAAALGRLTEVRRADVALHRRLCDLSGNRRTLRAHEGIDTEVQMLIACVDLERESLVGSTLTHLPIVEAIEARDVDRSVAAMRRHLRSTWDEVLRVYEHAGLLAPAAGGFRLAG